VLITQQIKKQAIKEKERTGRNSGIPVLKRGEAKRAETGKKIGLD